MQPKLFDTHTHFNFNAFKDDWEAVIERTLKDQVWFVNVGAEAKTSQRAVDIAKKYPAGVFAAVGLHPIHVYDDEYVEEVNGEKAELLSGVPHSPAHGTRCGIKFITKAEEFDKEYYSKLVKSNPKVVAIGETGLDYFHIKKFSSVLNKKLKAKQAEVFIEQIKLAGELNKPIIIHCRPDKDYDAYREILEILKNKPPLFPLLGKEGTSCPPLYKGRCPSQRGRRGIVHCFQGNTKILEEFLDLGFMIGYNGVITFTDQYDELVMATPFERIVLETDSPWLTPAPHRGKRNESIYVSEVAKRIAELKKNTFEEVVNVTTKNAMRIFRLNQ